MKSSTSKSIRSGRTLKIGLTVLGTILLGAIGSGIWARIGEPFTNLLTRLIINGINFVFSTYKDSIYIEASAGFTEYSANSLYLLFTLTLGMVYILIVVFHPWLSDRYFAGALENRARQFFRSRGGFLLTGVLLIIMLFTNAFVYTRISYTNRIITFAHRSIDRLAPFLTDQEEEELLAEFRSVRSAEDYYKFYDRLLKLHSKHGIAHHSVPPL